jgi:hypothetical protein
MAFVTSIMERCPVVETFVVDLNRMTGLAFVEHFLYFIIHAVF